ncbi:hypothetical protein FF011L_39390 [Roseimaritima multifibrata]|uniref:Uncharacterized protein n=1 Tax=Roseimaritima multifibrata TaxID=1930274 RepID=A0A517MJT8_9BACT|nr:hypothetical protein [Roseimaritima multifibrata]QDS95152.1 hypothetical protein FF011L_39390 [Roseimaritima multifibrata]
MAFASVTCVPKDEIETFLAEPYEIYTTHAIFLIAIGRANFIVCWVNENGARRWGQENDKDRMESWARISELVQTGTGSHFLAPIFLPKNSQ